MSTLVIKRKLSVEDMKFAALESFFVLAKAGLLIYKKCSLAKKTVVYRKLFFLSIEIAEQTISKASTVFSSLFLICI